MARTRGASERTFPAAPPRTFAAAPIAPRSAPPPVVAPASYESSPTTWERSMEAWECAQIVALALAELGVFPLVVDAARYAALPADLKRHFRARREQPPTD